jgi:hypothetical protein
VRTHTDQPAPRLPRARRMAPAAAALVALSVAGTAIADTTTKTDRGGDAHGEGPGRVDLKGASATHAHAMLEHTVDIYGRWPRGFTPPIAVYIDTASRRGSEYSVQSFPEGTFVTRLRDGKHTGRASFRKVDSDTIRYVFSKRAIGSPDDYRWQISVEGHGDEQVDALPNRGFVTHDLSLPAEP